MSDLQGPMSVSLEHRAPSHLDRPVTLVGGGTMGMAVLTGWLQSGLASRHVQVVDATASETLLAFARQHRAIEAAEALLSSSEKGAGEVRVAVTSPGGTTRAGSGVLAGEEPLTYLLTDTLRAAAARSRERAL